MGSSQRQGAGMGGRGGRRGPGTKRIGDLSYRGWCQLQEKRKTRLGGERGTSLWGREGARNRPHV